MVGRDSILSDLGDGLVSGPNDKRYTSILMGVRGSGKTVTLNELEDRAVRDGWIVLSMDASTAGLLERIVGAVEHAAKTVESLNMNHAQMSRSVEKSIGIKLGPVTGKLRATESRDLHIRMGIWGHLTNLVDAAHSNGTSVLLSVDELHSIDRAEGRRLANDLQHITRRSDKPLAFVGAGLPGIKHTLLRDRKLAFFQRCEPYDMPPVSSNDARIGLSNPIRSAGGSITPDALQAAADAVDGSPYKLQVIGDTAWRIAGGASNEIDIWVVARAIDAAQKEAAAKISMPAWYDLSESDQELLGIVASKGGLVTLQVIQLAASLSNTAATNTLKRLTDLCYVTRPYRGAYQLTDLVPPGLILEELGWRKEGKPNAVLPPNAGSHNPRRALKPKCRKFMPRSNSYCVLPNGHAGGCRSR
ncbi:MAG: ATP-binding protein [Acidimicrobiaceae bacterium]|nr:ATP-binding protein [Acidimicrobiaceae bacterium]